MAKKINVKQNRINARLKQLASHQRKGANYWIQESPFGDKTREEVQKHFKDIGVDAEGRFKQLFGEIQSEILNFDPIFLLTILSSYSQFGQFGDDPEAFGERVMGQAHVEICQALALQNPIESFKNTFPTPIEVMSFYDKVHEMMFARRHIPWSKLDQDKDSLEFKKDRLLELMRLDTESIRIWGYFHQVKHLTLGIFSKLESDIKTKFGVTVQSLWEMLEVIMRKMEDALNQRMFCLKEVFQEKTIDALFRRYHEQFQLNDTIQETVSFITDKGGTLEQAKTMLLMHSELAVPEFFMFTLEDFIAAYRTEVEPEALLKVLQRWSYSFGDLSGTRTEYLFLDNPIWKKPFIVINGVFIWPLPALLNSFPLEIFEQLISPSEHLTARYQELRSSWLEDETERLFVQAFPDAKVFKGSMWRDPIDNAKYENDLMIKVHDTLVIVEAKSGKVHPSARRGAPERFERVIKDLIVKPSMQSQRFVDFLQAGDKVKVFSTGNGTQHSIDVNGVTNFIRLNVTLEVLGIANVRWPDLKDAGFISENEKIAPTIAVSDLSSIFETLEHGYQKLHYLARRANIEEEFIYLADEMDLLVFYLDTGFDFPTHKESNVVMNLTSMSKSLDPYLMAKARPDLGIEVERPKMRLTRWWRDLLTRIEERQFKHWIQAEMILLDIGYESQKYLESEFRKIKKNVRRNWKNPNHGCAFCITSSREAYKVAVIGFAYKEMSQVECDEKARNVLNEVIVKTQCQGVVLLGSNVEKQKDDYPYSFLSLHIDGLNLRTR